MAQKKICVAFLGNKPSVLCKCSASYDVGGLMYCGRHVKSATKALDSKIDALTQAHTETKELATEECSICYESIACSSEQRTLPCGHAFHTKCVSIWFSRNANATCPMCRTAVPIAKKNDLEISLEYVNVVNVCHRYLVQPLFIHCAESICKNNLSKENEQTKRKTHRAIVKQLRTSLAALGVLRR